MRATAKLGPAHLLVPLGAALLWALLNATKPLTLDDTAYFYFARQIAAHPLEPYGPPPGSDREPFTIFWYDQPNEAFGILAPPVLLYWWALGMRLLPDDPFYWKLWLFPFCLLFAFSLHSLLRRFARGTETPVLLLTIFSPAFLPSLNLMLDVPALALGLTAMTLFVRACDQRSWFDAALAGFTAGLAMQTKYTAALIPPVILLYALLNRRLLLGLTAAVVATAVFAGWEGYLKFVYHDSHFLAQWRGEPPADPRYSARLAGLVGNLGGLAPVVALLGLAALGTPRWLLAVGAAGVVAGVVALGIVPEEQTVWLKDAAGHERLTLSSFLFGGGGVLVALVAVGLVLRTLGLRASPGKLLARPGRRIDLFLVGWLVIELAGYLPLTPFEASRRVLGLVLVLTLLAARLAARTRRRPGRHALPWALLTIGAALGLVYFVTDRHDAFAEKDAAEGAVRSIRAQSPDARIWFVGHWGFQFYAERAGMLPIVPQVSRLRAGDWVVRPEIVHTQSIDWDHAPLDFIRNLSVEEDAVPYRTVWFYYTGSAPLGHREGPRLRIWVYRVRRAFVAQFPHDG